MGQAGTGIAREKTADSVVGGRAQAGIGFHMLQIARVEKALERRPSLAARTFSEEERAYCESTARPAAHYAARIAARSAVLRALGVGLADGAWLRDVTVSRDEAGHPQALLTGRAAEVAREQGVQEVALSLSLTHEMAVANAVAVTDATRPVREERRGLREELRTSFLAARSVLDELDRYQLDPAGFEDSQDLVDVKE